jgi:hypothetical protein
MVANRIGLAPSEMTPDKRQTILDLFEAALERPASERVTFLDRACADDDIVHRRVYEMLVADAAHHCF